METLTSTTNELSDNDNVNTPRPVLLQRRVLQERLGSKASRADVGVETKLFSNPKKTLFWSDGSNTPLGSTNGTYNQILSRRFELYTHQAG